jgi:hypothetical protein
VLETVRLTGCRRVVGLVRVREWLVRRAGFVGCEPTALESETLPVCTPGPALSCRRVSTIVKAIPSFWSWFGMAPPPSCGTGGSSLFQQGDSPQTSTGGTTTKDLADNAARRQDDRHPSLQVRPDLDKLTVTSTTTLNGGCPISHTDILPADSVWLASLR